MNADMIHIHRVSIEEKSPYKESYTVDGHWKMFGDMIQPKVASLQWSDKNWSVQLVICRHSKSVEKN